MDASTASATNYLKKFTKHGGLVEGSGLVLNKISEIIYQLSIL